MYSNQKTFSFNLYGRLAQWSTSESHTFIMVNCRIVDSCQVFIVDLHNSRSHHRFLEHSMSVFELFSDSVALIWCSLCTFSSTKQTQKVAMLVSSFFPKYFHTKYPSDKHLHRWQRVMLLSLRLFLHQQCQKQVSKSESRERRGPVSEIKCREGEGPCKSFPTREKRADWNRLKNVAHCTDWALYIHRTTCLSYGAIRDNLTPWENNKHTMWAK